MSMLFAPKDEKLKNRGFLELVNEVKADVTHLRAIVEIDNYADAVLRNQRNMTFKNHVMAEHIASAVKIVNFIEGK